eukprot:7910333-Alexandrium_andersonii.AAC.1
MLPCCACCARWRRREVPPGVEACSNSAGRTPTWGRTRPNIAGRKGSAASGGPVLVLEIGLPIGVLAVA